jgi:hypothetical protein
MEHAKALKLQVSGLSFFHTRLNHTRRKDDREGENVEMKSATDNGLILGNGRVKTGWGAAVMNGGE